MTRSMKQKAIEELEGYEKALQELYTERCMSLAEGMLAGFSVIGVLSKDEGVAWLTRLQAIPKMSEVADD